jgi:hypothetical protein
MFLAVAICGALSLPVAAQTTEDWQLAHGGFVTASDVRDHNKLPQDRSDILMLLSGDTPDFRAALEIWAFGRNFPWRGQTHSLGRFADNYNGAMPAVLHRSIVHWGAPSYAANITFSALAGTAGFQGQDPALRIAFVDGATLATVVNWTRFELAMSERKAKAAEPNWALSNGSPKNWNEIFAFHFGPEGEHSVHAALEAVPEGAAVNAALYRALADGQPHLLEQRWAEDDAARVAALLHEGSLRLILAALTEAAGADDAARPAAVMRARGLWLAAAEAVLTLAPEEAPGIEAALAGSGDAALLPMAVDAVTAALARLTG